MYLEQTLQHVFFLLKKYKISWFRYFLILLDLILKKTTKTKIFFSVNKLSKKSIILH